MVEKDSIKDLFLEKIIFPRIFVIDSPGFITGRYIDVLNLGKFSRHVFLPEIFLVNLEKRLTKEPAGDIILYEWGKTCTWRFSELMGIPQFKKNDVNAITKTLFKFLGTMYYELIDCNADSQKKILKLKMRNVAVSDKTGKGYFIPLGAIAGLWSYLCNDKKMEATSINSKDSRGNYSEITAGPPNLLSDSVLELPNFSEFKETSNYSTLNKPLPLDGSSLKDMINQFFFKYHSGELEIWGERYFPFEIGYIYFIENRLTDLGLEHILYEESKKYFKEFSKSEKIENKLKFFPALMKALGWGDIKFMSGERKEVLCGNYPWTSKYSKNSKFPYFRGAFAGFYNLNFDDVQSNLSSGSLNISLSEGKK